MKKLSGVDNFRINADKKYYKHLETPSFRVFSDKTNSDAYDANYAVLKSLENVEDTIKQVEIFHEAASAVPLFVSSPDSLPFDEVKAALSAHNYEFCEEKLVLMTAIPRVSYKDIPASVCDIRAHKVLRERERGLYLLESSGQEYSVLMIDKKLASGARIFAAYNDEGEPVSICCCEGYGEMMFFSGVFTHPDYRCRGYAKALLCTALSYAHEKSYAMVFLYCENENAQRLYESVGFESRGEVLEWKAFKGGLPVWMQRHLSK